MCIFTNQKQKHIFTLLLVRPFFKENLNILKKIKLRYMSFSPFKTRGLLYLVIISLYFDEYYILTLKLMARCIRYTIM